MKYRLLLSFILFTFLSVFADIPAGYYEGTETLSGEELKTALHNIIDDHVEYSYNDLRDFILKASDEDPDNSNNVILLYTGWSYPKSGFGGSADDWNREHTWAKSHGNFGENPPCGTDAHQLRPTDASVNSARGNLDFDNGGSPYTDGDGATGCFRDDDSWEPRDEVKGDVARMIMYMAVRYEGDNGELDLEMADQVESSPGGEPLHGKSSTLLAWHHLDPPSEFEMNRNDVVYSYQQNRNPFIDHPEFAGYIWEGGIPNDNTPPLISNVYTISATQIVVDFNENVDETTSQTTSNYYINNGIGNPISAVRGYNGFNNQVLLTTSNLVNGTEYTVSVNNLEDLAGNPISANSQHAFSYIVVIEPELFYSETFELGAAGWTLQSSTSDNNWELTNSNESYHPGTVLDGEYYLYMNGYGADAPSEDWLISPQISGTHTNIILSVNLWTKYSDEIPGLSVIYSTDFSGDVEIANWQTLPITLPTADTDNWQIKTIEIPAARADFFIGFKYESSGTGAGTSTAWGVDAIQVSGGETDQEISAPTNVEITYSESNIILTWDSVFEATSYAIYGSSQPDGSYLLIDTVNPDITTLNINAADGKKFFYLKAIK